MQILVLGSGAGGGFPQWNCRCSLCDGQRSGRVRARARTQSSIAVSPDGERWVLLNASPDIAQQIREQPHLHPRHGLRHSPIAAIVLMDAQIDHVSGLLSLREGAELQLFATPVVLEELRGGLPLLKVLSHYCGVDVHPISVGGEQRQASFSIEGMEELEFEAVSIPGKAPPYSSHREAGAVGDNIALRVRDRRSGGRLFYAPGLASIGSAELALMRDADCLLVDGTFWRDDEMIAAGLGTKTASDMGHLPQTAGSDDRGPGMIHVLSALPAARKVLIHINNSNPILDERSAERALLQRHRIEVAHDGMELEL